MFSHRLKPVIVPLAALMALLLILSLGVAAASASPPEPLNFTFDVTYYHLPTTYGSGTWSSDGLITASGTLFEDSNHVGSGPGVCFRGVHTVDTLEAADGSTITLSMQSTNNDGSGCLTANMNVNWVILSGTGTYASLHGQGQGMVTGYVQMIAPGTFNYVINYDLQGQGHFHQATVPEG